jgi:hypothetical protein
VEAGHYACVLNISQAADVHRELRASVNASEREAGALHVPVGQPETFADLAETKSRIHEFR